MTVWLVRAALALAVVAAVLSMLVAYDAQHEPAPAPIPEGTSVG